jgi:hypothetical protein
LDTTDMGTTTKENVFSIRTQINFWLKSTATMERRWNS